MKKVQFYSNLKLDSYCVGWVRDVYVSAVRPLCMFHQSHVRGLQASSMGFAVLLVVTMLLPHAWASSSAPGPDTSGYEIPLGELNKVKKERPLKKEMKSRKKKKAESAAQHPATDVGNLPERVEQTSVITTQGTPIKVVPLESSQTAGTDNTDNGVSAMTSIPQSSIVPVTILHDPYSYVIAGKRTIIQAVISSVDSLRSVRCRFRALENGSYAIVPMVLAPDTNFTYAATLPGLAAESRALRYSIIATDQSGNETRSPEFVITVTSSAVMPGWQLASSPDKIKVIRENREQPLEGFSDPGIVE